IARSSIALAMESGMSLNTLVGHHLLGAAVTHTLLPETGYAATRLSRKIRFSIVALILLE
ncbi:hypothetical protein, partial [Escherichia coli]|uniref:hypothetical protein n=1 Tax=Escherichia coli TaxID=562 RepID=UPI0019549A9E